MGETARFIRPRLRIEKKKPFAALALFTLVLTVSASPTAIAADICYLYMHQGERISTCGGSQREMVSGASFPSLSDALNVNPASLPTIHTPFGIEWIGASPNTFANSAKSNMSFIKGFTGIGAGVTSNSDRSFYSPNLAAAFFGSSPVASASGYVDSSSANPGYNFGNAVALPIPALKKIGKLNVGGAIRYNRITQNWDPQGGVSLNLPLVSVGFAYSPQKGNQYIQPGKLYTFDGGFRLGILRFDYTHLIASTQGFTAYSDIYTGSLQWGSFMATGGYRTFTDPMGGKISLSMAAAQYQFSSRFVVGYYYNYLPGLQSLGVQFAI